MSVCVCVHGSACVCVCVCMCCFREEPGGKSVADAQVVGEDAAETAVETEETAGETAGGGDATGESATEIADKNQVVFFLMLHCGVHRHSQTVQLSDSAIAVFTATLRKLFFVVMHAPLRCLPPLSM